MHMHAMRGSISGIPNMPNMGDMRAQIIVQMQAVVPDLAEIQALEATMGTLGGLDAAQRNMAQTAATTQAI